MLSYRESGTARAKRSFGGGGCDQAGRSLLPPRKWSLARPPPAAAAGRDGEARSSTSGKSPGSPRGSGETRREASRPRPLLSGSWECTCRYSPRLRSGRLCPRSETGKRRAVLWCTAPSSTHSFAGPKGVACGLSVSLPFQVYPV